MNLSLLLASENKCNHFGNTFSEFVWFKVKFSITLWWNPNKVYFARCHEHLALLNITFEKESQALAMKLSAYYSAWQHLSPCRKCNIRHHREDKIYFHLLTINMARLILSDCRRINGSKYRTVPNNRKQIIWRRSKAAKQK